MASYKKRFYSEKEIEQMLQESGSEGEFFPKVKTVVKVKV
jgi:hypothetical protein